MTIFRGLSAFMITPADANGQVIAADIRTIIGRIVDAGVDSICVLGSTGGYAYLDPDQRRVVVEEAAREVGGRLPLIVGVGALRTDTAAALARHAKAGGADALLVAPMSYTPLTDDEVFAHYAALAEASDLPICVYNNPTTTHFTFTTNLLARLSAIPQICAVKMPLPGSGDFGAEMADLRASLPRDFSIGYSGDWGCAASMLAGADAFYGVAAGTWPAPMLRLMRAAQSGDAAETARVDAAFQPLWSLFRRHGSIRVVHRAANLLGLTDAQPPRPILPLLREHDTALHDAIATLDAV